MFRVITHTPAERRLLRAVQELWRVAHCSDCAEHAGYFYDGNLPAQVRLYALEQWRLHEDRNDNIHCYDALQQAFGVAEMLRLNTVKDAILPSWWTELTAESPLG